MTLSSPSSQILFLKALAMRFKNGFDRRRIPRCQEPAESVQERLKLEKGCGKDREPRTDSVPGEKGKSW